MSLYDSTRLQGPLKDGEPVDWSTMDSEIKAKLGGGKQVALLTQTYASPSTTKLIAEFKAKYANVKHVVYDAISEEAALNAFEASYGERALAGLRL